MVAHTVRSVRVGRVSVPVEVALGWVRDYTASTNSVSEKPYAYPAYDCFDGGCTAPDRLTDGDLLAPGLLNDPIKVRTFYGLQRIRGRLEDALRHSVLEKPLADINDLDRLEVALRALYGVLDSPTERPWGVKATTLSKVLHRKRPQSVVLHDKWVHKCYVGDEGPVPIAKNRSWAEYMVQITDAIRKDVAHQREAFALLANVAGEPRVLSDIRLLDIVAWHSRGQTQSENH